MFLNASIQNRNLFPVITRNSDIPYTSASSRYPLSYLEMSKEETKLRDIVSQRTFSRMGIYAAWGASQTYIHREHTLAISFQLLPASLMFLSLCSSAGVQGVFVRPFFAGGGCADPIASDDC